MAIDLQDYVNQTRRLLKDSGEALHTNTELFDYINEARERVSIDCHCFRKVFKDYDFTVNTEQYNLPTAAGIQQIIGVINVNAVETNRQYPLYHRPFSWINIKFRIYPTQNGIPRYITEYANEIWIAPKANKTYTSEWDVVYIPDPLLLLDDADTMTPPWTHLVKYWAAKIGFYKDYAYEQSDAMEKAYYRELYRNTGGIKAYQKFLWYRG